MIDTEQTIVAIASPTSAAPRGLVRMSGEETLGVLGRLGFRYGDGSAARRWQTDFDFGAPLGVLPVGLLLWPSRRSYTGQPSAEVHTYGSLPLLRTIVERSISAGARAARPGEFTMRAFLAGRLDLAQAEAVLGVIEAEGRGTLDEALRQLAGNLSRPLEQLRSTLLDLMADVEAGLDFVDEDIEFISDAALAARLGEVSGSLAEIRDRMRLRGEVSGRATVALCGRPNAGKSRLLNRLSGQQAALVAEHAGTTRDVVTVDCELDGHRVRLIDTAGLEVAGNEIGRLAQDQALQSSQQAQVRLWCVDQTAADAAEVYEDLGRRASRGRNGQLDLWVATKADLANTPAPSPWISTSAVTGEGCDRLMAGIVQQLRRHDAEEVGSVIGTAARCRDALRRAEEAIRVAIDMAAGGGGHELIATELRTAVDCLGEVTGAVYTDDILDRVFGRFCIGK